MTLFQMFDFGRGSSQLLTALLQTPLVGFKGPTSKGRGRQGREGQGKGRGGEGRRKGEEGGERGGGGGDYCLGRLSA